jgi:hypothetical protein
MHASIQKLDNTTSKSIQASLLFPTITSIIVDLVYHTLEASRLDSHVQVYVQFAPEWQVTVQTDTISSEQGALLPESVEGCSLGYLSYLGLLDIQCGARKFIQRVSVR